MYKAQISRTISSLACIMIPSKLGMHMLLDFVCIDWLQSKSVEDWLEKKYSIGLSRIFEKERWS